jgi:hypothetical protein
MLVAGIYVLQIWEASDVASVQCLLDILILEKIQSSGWFSIKPCLITASSYEYPHSWEFNSNKSCHTIIYCTMKFHFQSSGNGSIDHPTGPWNSVVPPGFLPRWSIGVRSLPAEPQQIFIPSCRLVSAGQLGDLRGEGQRRKSRLETLEMMGNLV